MINEHFFNQLLNEIHTITDSYKRVDKATGGNFNIFSVLKMERDEVSTHSRFIGELINPKGQHNQGSIFLQKFLNLIYEEKSEIPFGNASLNTITVKTEYYIGRITEDNGGRLDIIVFENGEAKLMIENKIDAVEQKHQLLRYKNKYPKAHLFFLTLDGKESETKDKFDNYRCISYKETILNWIIECRKEIVESPFLREIFTQYINLIKKITDQNLNTQMSQDIANRILRDKESFEAFTGLYKAKPEVLKEVIKNRLKQSLLEVERVLNMREQDIQLHFNEEKVLLGGWHHSWFGFSSPKLDNLNIRASFLFNVSSGYRNFIFGFAYIFPDKKDDTQKIKSQNSFVNKFNTFNESSHWPCYKILDEYNNWEDLETMQKIYFETEDFTQYIMEITLSMLEAIDEFRS